MARSLRRSSPRIAGVSSSESPAAIPGPLPTPVCCPPELLLEWLIHSEVRQSAAAITPAFVGFVSDDAEFVDVASGDETSKIPLDPTDFAGAAWPELVHPPPAGLLALAEEDTAAGVDVRAGGEGTAFNQLSRAAQLDELSESADTEQDIK